MNILTNEKLLITSFLSNKETSLTIYYNNNLYDLLKYIISKKYKTINIVDNNLILKKSNKSNKSIQLIPKNINIQASPLKIESRKETNRKEHNDSLKSEFLNIDTDQSGYIDINELQKGLEKQGIRLNSNNIKKIVKSYDDNPDNQLEFGEFMQLKRDIELNDLRPKVAKLLTKKHKNYKNHKHKKHKKHHKQSKKKSPHARFPHKKRKSKRKSKRR